MNWQDTVMSEDSMNEAIMKHLGLPMGQAIALEQAEISFKAGQDSIKQVVQDIMRSQLKANGDICYKAGIREVVERLELEMSTDRGFKCLTIGNWNLLKKEWGIDHER